MLKVSVPLLWHSKSVTDTDCDGSHRRGGPPFSRACGFIFEHLPPLMCAKMPLHVMTLLDVFQVKGYNLENQKKMYVKTVLSMQLCKNDISDAFCAFAFRK